MRANRRPTRQTRAAQASVSSVETPNYAPKTSRGAKFVQRDRYWTNTTYDNMVLDWIGSDAYFHKLVAHSLSRNDTLIYAIHRVRQHILTVELTLC